jgi:uncharacterized membrane protein
MPRWLDRLLDPSAHIAHRLQDAVVEPAWRRVTDLESFVPVSIAIGVAVILEAALPNRVAHVRWLFVAVSVVFLTLLAVVNPSRAAERPRLVRGSMLLLIALLTIANMVSGAALVIDLVNSEGIRDPQQLLLTGGAIWLSTVIVFSDTALDFLFPQMDRSDLVSVEWQPQYVDYLYLSFTNAMAFSPTDVMPLSRWAKLTMLMQSLVSLVLAVLVIARAVNILH